MITSDSFGWKIKTHNKEETVPKKGAVSLYLLRCFIRWDLIAPIDIGFLILGKCGTGIFRAVGTMRYPMSVGTCGKRTVAAERKNVFRPTAETMKGMKRQIGGKGIAVELL